MHVTQPNSPQTKMFLEIHNAVNEELETATLSRDTILSSSLTDFSDRGVLNQSKAPQFKSI